MFIEIQGERDEPTECTHKTKLWLSAMHEHSLKKNFEECVSVLVSGYYATANKREEI